MGRKRPLSPSSLQPELLLPSLKQSKLDTFLLSTQNSNSTIANSSRASPPPSDGLLDSPQPFPDEGEPMPYGMRCDPAKLLEKHSLLTAETVSRIYAQISNILDLLKEQHTIFKQILSSTSMSTFTSEPAIHPPDSSQPPRTAASPSKAPLSSATTPLRLVYQAHAAVISLHQTDLCFYHPSWSNTLQIKSHLAALLQIPVTSIDLMTFTKLSPSHRSSRILLEFHSDFIPGRLFAASSTLHGKGVFPHRFFRNLTISNLLPIQPHPTRKASRAAPFIQHTSSSQNNPTPPLAIASPTELEFPPLPPLLLL